MAGKDDFAKEKIYQEFAHFQYVAFKNVQKGIANNCLEEDAQGVPLELNSALQYHSGFVQSVLAKEENEQCGDFFEQFRKCAKGESPNFIKELRVGMKKVMMTNLIEAGIPILLKAKGV